MHDRSGAAGRRRWRLRLILLASSVFFTMCIAEAGCRAFAWSEERQVFAAWQQLTAPRKQLSLEEEAPLSDIVRLSRNPRIVYELFPSQEFRFIGKPCRINAHGFRGPEIPSEAPANAFRVLVLGDSVGFGWGVEEPECFPRQLEGLLQQRLSGRCVQLINTCVPGYNTAMEVATLVEKGLAFRPHLVVLHVVGNDLDLPNLIWAPQDFWTLRRSYLWDRVANSWRTRDPWSDRPWSIAPYEGGRFVYQEGLVAPQYRDMVGIEMFKRELGKLRDLSREHGFAVVVVGNMNAAGFVGDTCKTVPLPYVRANETIEPYMREHGVANYYKSSLTLSEKDPHPGAVAHRLTAEAILAKLQAERLLPQ